jgi:CHAT domain-containing protein/tetratricopeptide (TPR) repeat protein
MRSTDRFCRALLVFFCALCCSAAEAPEVPTLEPDKPIERELAGGQAHEYQIGLEANYYLHVIVDQRGIDVVVMVFDPAGGKLAEVDSPNGAWGPEPVYLLAATTGKYRLRVVSLDKNAAAGKYEAKIVDLRPATDADRARIAALAAVADGDRLQAQGTAESLRNAALAYEKALPLWRAAGDRDRESDTLSSAGHVYWRLGESKRSLEYYQQALPLDRASADRRREPATLHNIGQAYSRVGENQKALEFYQQALTLERAQGEKRGEANTLNNMGGVYSDWGENRKALEYYQQALPLEQAVQDRAAEEATLDGIGFLYRTLGEYQKALEYHQRALLTARAAGDSRGEAYVLVNIGMVYSNLGEKQKALEYYQPALTRFREVGDRRAEAVTVNNIGLAWHEMGENRKALEYYEQALPLRRALGDRSGEATTLTNIGAAHQNLGDKQQALEYYLQALPLRRAVGDRSGESATLSNVGKVYMDLGDNAKAMEYAQQALALTKAVGDRDREKAVDFDLARLETTRGNLAEARSYYESGLRIQESLRSSIASPELRASYFATRQSAYAGYIGLLLRLEKSQPSEALKRLAFETAENGRARSTLEMLRESHADIRQGADPALLEKEGSLTTRLTALAGRQVRLLSGKHTEEQAAAMQRDVDALENELQQVQAEIRGNSPRYAALTQPQPMTLPQIQRRVLDASTVLLEYSLGQDGSALFVVTPDSLHAFELPKQAEIDSAARRVYELLTARNRRVNGETEAQRRVRIAQAERDYPQAAGALTRMVLAPAADELRGKRLLVVADGALQYIPFGALPEPGGTAPLVVGHEVVSAPSAAVVSAVRSEALNRKPARNLVAVLADPVFEAGDPRVAGGHSGEGSAVRDIELERAAVDTGVAEDGLHLPRLVFTRDEAETIAKLAHPGFQALDFRANLATATSADLGSYRIVHFATHGLLNAEHPGLSGLVLSLVNEHGEPRDGFLSLSAVYNLNLSADLVVLSACQTALGKEIRGEGLVGLVRGFMYAGAPRVVASLWKVDDVATSLLMERFYRGMLVEKRPPAAALRAAQVNLWKQGQWSSPYYWAAFLIEGEWR